MKTFYFGGCKVDNEFIYGMYEEDLSRDENESLQHWLERKVSGGVLEMKEEA